MASKKWRPHKWRRMKQQKALSSRYLRFCIKQLFITKYRCFVKMSKLVHGKFEHLRQFQVNWDEKFRNKNEHRFQSAP